MNDYSVIVCAKRESSRLPGKNMFPLCGEPLIEHTFKFIENYLDVRLKNIWVVSDSDSILNLANKYSFGTIREPERFINNSHNMPLMRWIDGILKTNYYIMLPATAPVRSSRIIGFISDFLLNGYNDAHTVAKVDRGQYKSNGSLFMWHHSQLEKEDIISNSPKLYIDEYYYDIDTIEDLQKVERYMKGE